MGAMVFSPKQRRVLTWWRPSSPDRDRQAIICDGAVRSGKTLCTGLSFFCWAMSSFRGKKFRPVRPDHPVGASKSPLGAAAYAGGNGVFLQTKVIQKPH